MRVLVATNYSLVELEAECDAGARPRHHLWGLDAIRAAGHEVVQPVRSYHPWLRSISRALRFQLGDIARQLSVLRVMRSSSVDVAVLAEMGSMRALGLLRRSRLLRTPLVGVLHPSPPRSRLARWSAEGFDAVLALSSKIHAELTVMSGASSDTVRWGPDVSFAGRKTTPGSYVLSNGRTNRDHEVVARACAAAALPLRVDGSQIIGGEIPEVRISRRSSEQLRAEVEGAAVIAISLSRTNGTFGITELNDALLFGKPVVMTRNPFIDLDIEAVGCGYWIDLGDERAWASRLSQLMADPTLRRDMGVRGRAYAEQHWNYGHFTTSLLEAIARVGR